MTGKLIGRHEKVAYYGITDDAGNVVYHRMSGFTKMSTSKNPIEYSRRYIDESFEQTDIVAVSPSIAFTFDRYSGNVVHDDIVEISDNEILGEGAVRSIVVTDLSTDDGKGNCRAVMRNFSIMVETEGDSLDAYTLSGTMNTKGEKISGTAVVSQNGETLTFNADE